MDQEEAELRKEQLRLQNLVLAQQVEARLRAEQRMQATTQLAQDASRVGLKVAKWSAIVLCAMVGITFVVCLAYDAFESSKRSETTLDHAKELCRSGEMTNRIFVTTPSGERGSVLESDIDKMPPGSRIGKNCAAVWRGEYPY